MKSNNYKEIVKEIFKSAAKEVGNENDFDKENQLQLLKRDRKYSELLEHFVFITRQRNFSKEKYKWKYFKILMGMMITLCAIIVITITVMLIKCNAKQLVSCIPVLITAFSSFATTIISIPLVITKYLFSTKEDEYITSIISHTQEHDLSNRRIIKEYTSQSVTDTNLQTKIKFNDAL